MAASSRGPVSRGALGKAIIDGIKQAQNDYSRMSGGSWVWEGAEYWITTHVARRLWKIVGDSAVIIEGSSDATLEEAGRRRGRKPNVTKKKRYDIVVYFKTTDTPRAVVEIKRVTQTSRKSPLKDVKRIVAALKSAKLRFGAVGYYFSASGGSGKDAKEKISDYVEMLESEAQALASKRGFSVESMQRTAGDKQDAWVAGCLLIERKQGNPLN